MAHWKVEQHKLLGHCARRCSPGVFCSTSPLAVQQSSFGWLTGAACHMQVLAGVLEMSIQTDIPVDLSGSRQAAVVTTMAVLPSMQRQGIGTALLDAAQDWAASLDIRIVALFVYRDNDAAIRY